jgi:hypothetical protein
MGLDDAACFTGSLNGVIQVSRKAFSQIKQQVAQRTSGELIHQLSFRVPDK